MLPRASPTNPNAALHAVRLVALGVTVDIVRGPARCTRQYVPSAAKKPPYHSDRVATGPFTAATASASDLRHPDQTGKVNRYKKEGRHSMSPLSFIILASLRRNPLGFPTTQVGNYPAYATESTGLCNRGRRAVPANSRGWAPPFECRYRSKSSSRPGRESVPAI